MGDSTAKNGSDSKEPSVLQSSPGPFSGPLCRKMTVWLRRANRYKHMTNSWCLRSLSHMTGNETDKSAFDFFNGTPPHPGTF